MLGYVQCDIEVPDKLKPFFANFPPLLKITLVDRKDIGKLMKQHAEEGLMSQPQNMLISSFTLQNGTLITPLLLFYLEMGLVCTKTYRFVEYTPKKCCKNFVQSAVDGRRQGDENPNSSLVTKTMKLLAKSYHRYQILNRSRHTVTKYLNDDKKRCAINSKFFCDIDKFEELEMDTDPLYLAEIELTDCIRPEMQTERQRLRSRECDDSFAADASGIFPPNLLRETQET